MKKEKAKAKPGTKPLPRFDERIGKINKKMGTLNITASDIYRRSKKLNISINSLRMKLKLECGSHEYEIIEIENIVSGIEKEVVERIKNG